MKSLQDKFLESLNEVKKQEIGKNPTILLYKLDSLDDGTERFQTQLSKHYGRNTADFIRGKDGIMKAYDKGNKGFDYYKYDGKYKIVNDKNK